MFPWEQEDGLWATKSEDVGLIVRSISFIAVKLVKVVIGYILLYTA